MYAVFLYRANRRAVLIASRRVYRAVYVTSRKPTINKSILKSVSLVVGDSYDRVEEKERETDREAAALRKLV